MHHQTGRHSLLLAAGRRRPSLDLEVVAVALQELLVLHHGVLGAGIRVGPHDWNSRNAPESLLTLAELENGGHNRRWFRFESFLLLLLCDQNVKVFYVTFVLVLVASHENPTSL